MRASKPLPLRVEENLRKLVDKMVEFHGRHTVTDYIHGLVVLDAYRNEIAEWLHQVAVPSCVTGSILALPSERSDKRLATARRQPRVATAGK
jgi:uncharacterized iron-regulated membrane protein